MPLPQGLRPITNNMPSSLDILTLDTKDLVKKIQDLSHLGIEDSKIALPKICVVGDQSTGKSSLIEGISEIKVPRSAGTCTRCPMEINLSESEKGQPWQCVVYLSRRYWYNPSKKMSKSAPTKSEPLGPWLPYGGQEDETFVTLTDKTKVQEAIWWAQLAILNPSTDSQEYVPGKHEATPQTTQVKFSPNVVRLDISAPSFPALSFYDLPGVISQAEQDEESYLVRLVENLVQQYVSQENCIVLLTMTMTDDATNSSASKIIRNIKFAKERTLGVLTKPDRLSGYESLAQWIEILEGKKFRLGHGYYVVRNNPNHNVGHAQAREEEEAFFADQYWAGQLTAYRHRCGVRRLQAALSAMLMQQIQKCLPSIIDQIDQKAERVDAELKTLPPAPTEDVQRILIEKTTTLGLKFSAIFNGGNGFGCSSNILQPGWNYLVMDFQKALDITKPKLITLARSDNQDLADKPDSECEIIPTPRLKRKAPGPDPSTPENNSQSANANTLVYSTDVFEKWTGPGNRFTLEEVRKVKEESHRAGIPNQIDPTAIETLNRKSVEHWKGPSIAFVSAVHDLVHQVLYRTLEEVVGQYQQTPLYRELRGIIDNFLAHLRSAFLDDALARYDVEHQKPFTMDQVQHKRAMQEALRNLTLARTLSRKKCYLRLRHLDTEDEGNLQKLKADLGPDQYSQEVEMMAVSH